MSLAQRATLEVAKPGVCEHRSTCAKLYCLLEPALAFTPARRPLTLTF